jgi:tRNA modification GTPase
MYLPDTIVAPATPPGQGAVAIVRLSGPRAIEIARTLWHPLRHASAEPGPRSDVSADVRSLDRWRLHLGEIRDPQTGTPLDQALCVLIPGPRSLTGEDVAELHCHGGIYLVRRIVALATAAGARIAEPGEFSRRAFLNGRIGLTEAEAVADLVNARGETALRQAIAQLDGALAARVGGLRRQVIALRAHLEAEIDFGDEDLRLPSRNDLAGDLVRLLNDVTLLHDSFARGRIAREGARAAIIGKPNAGKSSVLNLLLGSDRAIVTPIAGTTRDVIEESIQLGGSPLVIEDTAGIRESRDEVERIGIDRARRHACDADLLIPVFDSALSLDPEDIDVIDLCSGRPGVALLNKCDLPQRLAAAALRSRGLGMPIIEFSALTAAGVPEMRAALEHEVAALTDRFGGDGIAISRERHRAALATARDALETARLNLAAMPPEIVAVDVALAAEALGAITGEVSTEDVLDAIFREFCIGK